MALYDLIFKGLRLLRDLTFSRILVFMGVMALFQNNPKYQPGLALPPTPSGFVPENILHQSSIQFLPGIKLRQKPSSRA
jgi:hypothetical protein